MKSEKELEHLKLLVNECIKEDRIDFLVNLIYVLQQNYKDIALLCTDGNYHAGWSHDRVIDYITHET
jgi:hypothetical protein